MSSKKYNYYIEQNTLMHQNAKAYSGHTTLKYIEIIKKEIKENQCSSLLDYGCGKGKHYLAVLENGFKFLEYLNISDVTKYDPCYPEFNTEPEREKYDCVICTDVLEHIPEEDISWVIDRLMNYTSKVAIIAVGFGPAKKHLPNGENAHICDKPEEWWAEKFQGWTGSKLILLIEPN